MQQLKTIKKASNGSDGVGLISDLLAALDKDGVQYCHWKSNWRIDRWLGGDGDLDLLVGRKDIGRFTAVLSTLGFKRAIPPKENELPAVLNFYSYDSESQKFVNVHAHYQLVFGHDLTNNYRIPIESSFLSGAEREAGIYVASPEMELVIFVMRRILNYSVTESLMRRLTGRTAKYKKISRELGYLESAIDTQRLKETLQKHFPTIEPEFFEACLNSLRANASGWQKVSIKSNVKRHLSNYSRSSTAVEFATRLKRGISVLGRTIARQKSARKKFEGGGMLLAIVGGDGAGKTTGVEDISKWLSKKFAVRTVHFGKPPKSFITLLAAAAFKAEKLILRRGANQETEPGLLQRLRWLSTARDRHKLYKKVRRYAANGEIVVCDRYPIKNMGFMDAPRIPGAASLLSRIEQRYYLDILPPEQLFVLRVEPEVAVDRKLDEPEEHVRVRSTALWNFDWKGSGAQLIDANLPLSKVLSDLRKRIWASL